MSQALEYLNNFSIDAVNREIFLHKHPSNDEDEDIENRMSSIFIKNLRYLDQKDAPILIHLNAGGGGHWTDGMAIYDAIFMAESFITVLIYGYACSMSSIIPQAADLRIAMPNSYMMCHYGLEESVGNHMDFQLYSKFSTILRHQMIGIYSARMVNSPFLKIKKKVVDKLKYSENFINKKLKEGDWYLTVDDMIYYGFIDYILGSSKYPNIRSIKYG